MVRNNCAKNPRHSENVTDRALHCSLVEKGLGHKDTRTLAYLFAIALDGGKSGKFIKESKLRELQSKSCPPDYLSCVSAS